MPSEMWLLILVTSLLALNLNCNADGSVNIDGEIIPDGSGLVDGGDTVESRSNKADSMVKAAANIANAGSVDDIMKQMKLLSRNFPAELLKDKSLKPHASKFKRNYDALVVKTKPILVQARKLEKLGKKASKKQLDAFAKKFKTLQNHVDRFSKTASSESKKLRNSNLRLIKDNPNDEVLVEDAKRFINVADIFHDCVEFIKKLPSTINCFIFGICETNSGGAAGGSNVSDVEEEEEEEEGDEEVDDDDEVGE